MLPYQPAYFHVMPIFCCPLGCSHKLTWTLTLLTWANLTREVFFVKDAGEGTDWVQLALITSSLFTSTDNQERELHSLTSCDAQSEHGWIWGSVESLRMLGWPISAGRPGLEEEAE